MTVHVPQTLLASKATRKELKKALGDLAALVERERQQVRSVAAAEHDLAAAERDERKAAADAIRAGKAIPASGLREQREMLEEMRREAAALELAVRDARQAVAEEIDANRPAWREAHEGVPDERRRELIAAVEALEAANEALRGALEANAFLFGGPQHAVGVVPLLRHGNDEPLFYDDLIAAVRFYVSGEPWRDRPGYAEMQRARDEQARIEEEILRKSGVAHVEAAA